MIKLTVGRLAKKCEVNEHTIRYYERIGLVVPEGRTKSGYRFYSYDSVLRVKFIKKAQGLGFNLDEIGMMLNLHNSDAATAKDVLNVTKNKITEFKSRINDLTSITKILEELANKCPGDGPLSECPILDYFHQNDGLKK